LALTLIKRLKFLGRAAEQSFVIEVVFAIKTLPQKINGVVVDIVLCPFTRRMSSFESGRPRRLREEF
jgi:hypothetical protein